MPDENSSLPSLAEAIATDAAATVEHATAVEAAGAAAANARIAEAAATAAQVGAHHAATAHTAATAVVVAATPIASLLSRVSGVLDIETWPQGSIPAVIVVSVVATSIAGFWHGEKWELPSLLATLLPMVWGFVMALSATSSLKAWMVLILLLNLLAMVLILPGGWTPPVLTTLAVAGASQYVVGKALRQDPTNGTNGSTNGAT